MTERVQHCGDDGWMELETGTSLLALRLKSGFRCRRGPTPALSTYYNPEIHHKLPAHHSLQCSVVKHFRSIQTGHFCLFLRAGSYCAQSNYQRMRRLL